MVSQGRKRRTFTPEFRAEAARLVIETQRPVTVVARELGLANQLLNRWVHQELARQDEQASGELTVDERAELKRLRREVKQLREDNDFLGKAAAFFASKRVRLNDSN